MAQWCASSVIFAAVICFLILIIFILTIYFSLRLLQERELIKICTLLTRDTQTNEKGKKKCHHSVTKWSFISLSCQMYKHDRKSLWVTRIVFLALTWGGGSMKWNSSRFCTPRDFSKSTTFARLVLWISGTVVIRSSFLYECSVYSRKHCLKNYSLISSPD